MTPPFDCMISSRPVEAALRAAPPSSSSRVARSPAGRCRRSAPSSTSARTRGTRAGSRARATRSASGQRLAQDAAHAPPRAPGWRRRAGSRPRPPRRRPRRRCAAIACACSSVERRERRRRRRACARRPRRSGCAGSSGCGRLEERVVRVRPVAAADRVDVARALGDDERGARAGALDRVLMATVEPCTSVPTAAAGEPAFSRQVEDAGGEVVRRRQRLGLIDRPGRRRRRTRSVNVPPMSTPTSRLTG